MPTLARDEDDCTVIDVFAHLDGTLIQIKHVKRFNYSGAGRRKGALRCTGNDGCFQSARRERLQRVGRRYNFPPTTSDTSHFRTYQVNWYVS